MRVRWTALRHLRFTDPFFEDTVGRARAFPENRPPTVTEVEALLAAAAAAPAPAPHGFLLHVSRCGSTLLSQQLALDDRCIVLSEAPVLDDALRLHLRHPGVVTEALGDRLFLAALGLLGRRRFPAEERLFVKGDSWHVHFHGRLRRLFPRVPMVLLHREPAAVLESHRRQPGMHAVRRDDRARGLRPRRRGSRGVPAAAAPRSRAAHVLRALPRRPARRPARARPRLPARRRPRSSTGSARSCGHEVPASLAGRLAERSRFHAKRPGQAFEEVAPPPVPVSAVGADPLRVPCAARRRLRSHAMTSDPVPGSRSGATSGVSSAAPRELYVEGARARALRDELPGLPTWDLGEVRALDLGLLLDGSFAPLDGYMGRAALESVAQSMRLPDGRLWPMPLSLDVDAATARALRPGDRLALRHAEGMVLAVVHVEDVFEIDVPGEARALFGTDETSHPGVFRHLRETTPWRVAGRVEGLEAPPARAPSGAATSPREVRRALAALGHERVVAFQTRNPLHRAHLDLTLRALEAVDGTLLLHPVVGRTAPGDVPAAARLRCYEAVLPRFPAGRVLLAALPLAMRMAGPREALWHALIRRNYGATHFIVGRDHAAPGPRPDGRPFYGPYDAQRLLGVARRRARRDDPPDGGARVPARRPDVARAVRGAGRRHAARLLGDRAAPPPARRHAAAGLVHGPRGGGGAPGGLPAPPSAGLRPLPHGALGRGEVDPGAGADRTARGDRAAPGDRPRRRPRPQAAVGRARLLEGGSRDAPAAASRSSPPRSSATAASPCAPPSRPTAPRAARPASSSRRSAASSRSTSPPRSRRARRGTARASTPRRAPGSSRASRASTTRTSRPSARR